MMYVSRAELAAAEWRTSRHSGARGGERVEVADGSPRLRRVPVRVGARPGGGPLFFSDQAWSAFIDGLRVITSHA